MGVVPGCANADQRRATIERKKIVLSFQASWVFYSQGSSFRTTSSKMRDDRERRLDVKSYPFEGGRCTLSKMPKEPAQGCLAREGDEVSGKRRSRRDSSMLAHSCPNNLMLATMHRSSNKTTKESKIKHRKNHKSYSSREEVGGKKSGPSSGRSAVLARRAASAPLG